MRFYEIEAANYTAFIHVYNIPPNPPLHEDFLRYYSNSIASAIADGGVKIEWLGPQSATPKEHQSAPTKEGE